MRNAKAKLTHLRTQAMTDSPVLADGREEAEAGREKSFERRWQWRAAARLLLRASEREGESASRGARLAAGTEADAAGHT